MERKIVHSSLFKLIEDGAIKDMTPAEAAEFGYFYAIERLEFVINAAIGTLDDHEDREEATIMYGTLKELVECIDSCGSPNTKFIDEDNLLGKPEDESYH